MDWARTAGNVGGGAAAGSAFGPWGTAAGAGLGLINSFMDDPNEAAQKKEQQGYDQSQGYLQPYNQNGQDQYGRLNDAAGKLSDPAALQDEWSKSYKNSDYAKQLLSQNQSSGMDAASAMGLSGSSAALGNIQQGAGNIVAQDRQQYMNDLMDKYMKGIGLGQNLYGVGANAAGQQSGQAQTHGENQANLEYKRINDPQKNLTQGIGSAINSYNKNPGQFNSNGQGYLS